MTPQEKNVFGKLFTKTELGSHNVKLGLLQDTEKAITEYFNSTDTANSKIKGDL